MAAMGSILTNKYAEGYPGKRYYGGCECVDVVERPRKRACQRAVWLRICKCTATFRRTGKHGSIHLPLLTPGRYRNGHGAGSDGGHLTHGSPVNMSGKYFHVVPYGVNENGYIDYDEVLRIAKEAKPKLIVAGASAYPRTLILRNSVRLRMK